MSNASHDLVLTEQTLERACEELERASAVLRDSPLRRPPTLHTITRASAELSAYLWGVEHAKQALIEAAVSAGAAALLLRDRSTALDREGAAALPGALKGGANP